MTLTDPPDPLHCTYNYLTAPGEEYLQAWEEEKEGLTESLTTSCFIQHCGSPHRHMHT